MATKIPQDAPVFTGIINELGTGSPQLSEQEHSELRDGQVRAANRIQ